jgi:hypothetical protein
MTKFFIAAASLLLTSAPVHAYGTTYQCYGSTLYSLKARFRSDQITLLQVGATCSDQSDPGQFAR